MFFSPGSKGNSYDLRLENSSQVIRNNYSLQNWQWMIDCEVIRAYRYYVAGINTNLQDFFLAFREHSPEMFDSKGRNPEIVFLLKELH